ncbi:MAG: DHH family phosphoesterase [Ignisphaera sp.]
MVIKAFVIYHGDCDGVISAGLYIRHFLLDYVPNNIMLKYSQPWRLQEDLNRCLKNLRNADTLVLLDLAIGTNIANKIKEIVGKNEHINIVIIDHHSSSMIALKELQELEPRVKVLWSKAQSTPEVLAHTIIRDLNGFEEVLVKVANVCEGGSANEPYIREIADKIKLVLAVEPTNEHLIKGAVEAIIKGVEFWNSKEFNEKYSKAKWLLQTLLKRIEEKIEHVCDWNIATFRAAESIIYAGLFGVASSEYIKKTKQPIVIVREEEEKIVITVRSLNEQALEFCKSFALTHGNNMSIIYGGHREAASMTIKTDKSLVEVIAIVKNFIKEKYCCCKQI